MAGKKLIKELIVNVKAKNIKGTVKDIDTLTQGLEDSAAGAELLTESLGHVPAALKKIQAEGKEASAAMKFETSGSFEQMEGQLDDVIIGISELQDIMKTGFISSMESSERSTLDLVKALDRLDDAAAETTEAMDKYGNVAKKQEGFNRKAADSFRNLNSRGNNTTRMFSDLSRIAGPIPAMYAVIAANVYALREAFRYLTEGDQLNRLERVGTIMGAQVGVPVQEVARELQEATNGALNYGEALRQASSAATFGFSIDQISEMGVVARRASVALGVDMSDAMNRVVRGVSKLEIELMDELGITVRLTEAFEDYGQTIGKAGTQLNSYEKQQAYLLAVQKQSLENQGAIDKALDPTGWEMLGVEMGNLTNKTMQFLAKAGEPLARKLAEMLDMTDASKAIESIGSYIETAKEARASFEERSSMGLDNDYEATSATYIAIEDFKIKKAEELALVEKRLDDQRKEAERRMDSVRGDLSGIATSIAGGEIVKLMEKQEELKTALLDLDKAQADVGAILLNVTDGTVEGNRELSVLTKRYAQAVRETVPEMQSQLSAVQGQIPAYVRIESAATEILEATEGSAKAGNAYSRTLQDTATKAREVARAMKEASQVRLATPLITAGNEFAGLMQGSSALEISLKNNTANANMLVKNLDEAAKLDRNGPMHNEARMALAQNTQERLVLERALSLEQADQLRAQQDLTIEQRHSNDAALFGVSAHGSALAKLHAQRKVVKDTYELQRQQGDSLELQLRMGQELAGIDQAIAAEQQAIASLNMEAVEARLNLTHAEQQYALVVKGVSSDLELQSLELEQQREATEFRIANASRLKLTEADITELKIAQVRHNIEALNIEKQRRAEAFALWEIQSKPIGTGSSKATKTELAAYEVMKAEREWLEAKEDGNRNNIAAAEQALEIAKAQKALVDYEVENYRKIAALKKMGFEDQTNMNSEEKMISDFNKGMELYDNAFSALSQINPAMGEMFTNFQGLTGAIMTMGDTFENKMNVVGQGIQAVSSMMQVASQGAVREIDKQIAMEKKRDGKSEESKRKIAKLEMEKQKKEKQAAKQQIIMNTAQAVMMSLATLGLPLGIPFAVSAAAMGAMMLSQVDSGTTPSVESASPGKLELGKRDNSIDLARGANAGELSFLRGERGIGSSGNFAPRARGGSSASSGLLVGEHGAEFVQNPASRGGRVVSNDTASKDSKQPLVVQFSIDALDSQSFIDRSEDIFQAVQTAANARGFEVS